MNNIFEECPTFETTSFILRLVSEDDAQDLLICYSDPKSQAVFDSENLSSNLHYKTIEEMTKCIQFWLREYHQKMYVRFAVISKENQKPIGTVEMFNAKGHLLDYDKGILRIDLASAYETSYYLSEILDLANHRFYELFGTDMIVLKGRPTETNRIDALIAAGYEPYDWHNPDRKHYYSRVMSEL